MKFLWIFVVSLALSGVCGAAYAQQEYEIALHREKPIHFSNEKTADLLTVNAVGSKAFNTVLLITIRRHEDRYPIFADALIAKEATPIHWQEFSIDDLNGLISEILLKSTRKAADLPSWKDVKKSGLFCDSAEICPRVEKEVYARVRSSGRPLFCYAVHYEVIKCAWFDDEWGTGRIVTQISW